MQDMTEAERQILFEWSRSACDAAVYAGLVIPPWRPTEYAYGLLHGYYMAGLTPAEGAEALFAVRH